MESNEDSNALTPQSTEEGESLNVVEPLPMSPLEDKVINTVKQPFIKQDDLIFAICVIDFHHIRGPEIEYWCDSDTTLSNQEEQVLKFSKIWPNLPFQALPDGAHLFEETFSTFTLLYNNLLQDSPEEEQEEIEGENDDFSNVTTLFGCACIRQLDSSEIINKTEDITRSIVQKSMVVISRYPITIQLREKLSIVTKSFFLQKNFQDKSVIKQLYDNVNMIYNNNKTTIQNDIMDHHGGHDDLGDGEVLYESDFYTGLNLKEMISTYKRNLLIILKLVMLEKKIVFFSKNLLKLSSFQFSVLSLIPNLVLNLQDCGSPKLDNLSRDLKQPNSFNILDRGSILKFIGLPLQIFNKGGFFEPYLSLQQLDSLKKLEWYLVGTSNDLLLDQKQKIADLIVYIDHNNNNHLEFLNNDLEKTLQLTSQDKKFMDNLIRQVDTSYNNNHDTEEKEMTSAIYSDLVIEDMIRTNFENYLIGLISSVKYDNYLLKASNTQLQSLQVMNNNINQFNKKFIEQWKETKNFKIFDLNSYDEFFTMDEFKPAHVGNEIEDVNFFKFINQQRDKLSRTWNNGNFGPVVSAKTTASSEPGDDKTGDVDDQDNENKLKAERKGFIQAWKNWGKQT